MAEEVTDRPNCACGKPARRLGTHTRKDGTLSQYWGKECSACYMAAYRKTKTGKESHARTQKKYARSQKGKETRRRYVRNWRLKTGGYLPPEVHELRRAIKAVDRAIKVRTTLKRAGVRGPGE